MNLNNARLKRQLYGRNTATINFVIWNAFFFLVAHAYTDTHTQFWERERFSIKM